MSNFRIRTRNQDVTIDSITVRKLDLDAPDDRWLYQRWVFGAPLRLLRRLRYERKHRVYLREQAEKFSVFAGMAEDWNDPSMDVYDEPVAFPPSRQHEPDVDPEVLVSLPNHTHDIETLDGSEAT